MEETFGNFLSLPVSLLLFLPSLSFSSYLFYVDRKQKDLIWDSTEKAERDPLDITVCLIFKLQVATALGLHVCCHSSSACCDLGD